MVYLLLGVAALAVTSQNVFKQKFNTRSNGGVFLFGGMISFVAMICFLLLNRDWSWNPLLILPAAAFAASYATATVFAVLAIKHGSLAKTTLISACSLLIPSFYGMIFLNDSVSVTLVLGILLLLVALVMINYERASGASKSVTWKWWVFVFLAFLGNGMCSTVQKIEQVTFGQSGKNLFMIMALAMVTAFLLVLSITVREERTLWSETLKKGWKWALLCGSANALTNFLVLYLNEALPASVMFPVISAGGIVFSFLYATVFAKERFDLRQKLGFIIGVASVILLNV